jgi:hypothetical protein
MTTSPKVPLLLLLQLVLGASLSTAQTPTPSPSPSPTATPPPAADTASKPECAKNTKIVKLGDLPKDLSNGRSAQLQVTTCSAKGGALAVTVPSGFSVQPASQEVTGSTTAAQSWIFNVTPPARDQVLDNGWIRAELRAPAAGNQPAQTLGTDVLSVSYHVGQPVLAYFVLGLLGVALGYVLRKVVKALAETTPSSARIQAAVAAEPTPGWLKQFVADHYYGVDFTVTLFLGFLLLGSALTVDHAPPIRGQYWFGALLFGFATGLLTNSELITHLPVRQ